MVHLNIKKPAYKRQNADKEHPAENCIQICAYLMLHSAQNRHRQIGTKQREEEPVYGKGFCIQDIIQNSWKALVYGSFIKSRQIQLCRKAPEQKRNQSTRYSLFQKFHRGIPLPIIQQVGAGQHEEHRNRPVKKSFQKAGGDPESPSRLCPEHKICMKNDHSEAGCHICSCHVEFFLICFRMTPPLQGHLASCRYSPESHRSLLLRQQRNIPSERCRGFFHKAGMPAGIWTDSE